jgi:hypothetical protein
MCGWDGWIWFSAVLGMVRRSLPHGVDDALLSMSHCIG